MAEEFIACEEIVQADPRWQEAMRKRGVTDFSLTMVDPWASSWTGPDDDAADRRIARPLTFVRSAPGENGYARPVEGLICEVDLDARRGPRGHRPRRRAAAARAGQLRGAVALRVRERAGGRALPRGPQADRDHPARGPELHRRRPRRVLAEVAGPDRLHPAGGPGAAPGRATRAARSSTAPRSSRCTCRTGTRRPPTASRTCSTRVSTAWAGWPTRSMLGCDCVGHIHYFDGVVNDNDGGSVVIPNAVCMHEEDAGIGWKHMDFRTEATQVRRRRRLVISTSPPSATTSTGTSGTSTPTARSSTRSSSPASSPPARSRRGRRPSTARSSRPASTVRTTSTSSAFAWTWPWTAPQNTVVEIDSVPSAPGPDNPHGNAWETRRTVLASEAGGAPRHRRRGGRGTGRSRAPSGRPRLGAPTAYALMPGGNVPPMYSPDAVYAPAVRVHRAPALGHRATTRRSGSRRATTPTSSRSARACRSSARGTGRWRAPTSWSGTRSGRTTSCVRRTGR